MQYIIRGKSFVFTTEIRDNTTLRKSFFSLARQTFDLDFEPWYQCGGWQDRYLPHALVCGEQVAANVSVNRMDFQLDGRRRTYLQLGTVMTHPDYRGMGLSRFLMEWILQNWSDRCDGIYLFANDPSLDSSQPRRHRFFSRPLRNSLFPCAGSILTTPKTGRF